MFMSIVALLCNLDYKYVCRLKEIKSLIVNQVTKYIIWYMFNYEQSLNDVYYSEQLFLYFVDMKNYNK